MTPWTTLDARGHRCPVPTLRLRKALEAAPLGAVIELVADDPMARIDVPHFAATAGHRLVSVTPDSDAIRFLVEKG